MENLVAGIDIGGTTTKFGIVGRNGKLHSEGAIPTKRHRSFASFVTQLSRSLRAKLRRYPGCCRIDLERDHSLRSQFTS